MLRLMVILLGVSFLAACAAMPEEQAAVEAEVAAVEEASAEEEAMVEETVVEDTTAQVTVESPEIEPRETVGDFVALGDTVYFELDSHELDAEAQRLLIDQAAFLNRNPQFLLTIEGHCDERGTREYNYALGERARECGQRLSDCSRRRWDPGWNRQLRQRIARRPGKQ